MEQAQTRLSMSLEAVLEEFEAIPMDIYSLLEPHCGIAPSGSSA